MASVDSRIVTMKFENTQFQQGATQTLSMLEKLKQNMNFTGVGKGLDAISGQLGKIGLKNPFEVATRGLERLGGVFTRVGLQNPFQTAARGAQGLHTEYARLGTKDPFAPATRGAADLQKNINGLQFSNIEGGITGVNKSFVAMSVVGITALANIVSASGQAAAQISKNLIFQAPKDGFDDYQLKIGATQTIMAGTGENIQAVTKYLKELDIYADETIYSLSDMTNNIGKFTNAGVKLDVAVGAMKGIANVAAISGASSNEAARAMYNLGQAIGQGTVRMMDWRSVELANMGTKEFKEQLIDAALAAGTLTKSSDGTIKSLKGNEVNFKTFSATLQDQWLSAEALTDALGKYSDKTTDIGKRAYAAAQDVKTFSMLMETAKAAAGTGWTDTFEIVIGNLPEATKMWTSLSEVIGGIIGRSADARNEMLQEWKDLGGRNAMIEGIAASWAALMSVITPIKEAFREIFPRQTGEGLYELTVRFREFAEGLKLGETTMNNLRRTFAGVFAVFSIIGQVIGGVLGMFGRLFGVIGQGTGGFLTFTGSIGDILVAFDKFLERSGLIQAFFQMLGNVLAWPIQMLGNLGGLISRMFMGFDGKGASALVGALETLGNRANPLASAGERLTQVWEGVSGAFQRAGDGVKKAGKAIGDALGKIGDAIAEQFNAASFDRVLDVINTGLFAAIVLALKNFFKSGINIDLGGGIFTQVRETLSTVTETMKSMQQQVKADVILKIAAALAILAASVFILSTVDSKKLTASMTALGVGFAAMSIMMKTLAASVGIFSSFKIPVVAAGLILLATSIVILSTAVKILSTMTWEELARGLSGVVVLIGALVLAARPLDRASGGLMRAGLALIPLAIGIRILASAVSKFADMSWSDLGRGLTGMAAALVAIALAMRIMPKNMLMQAVNLNILGQALETIASVVIAFSTMKWQDIGRGLAGMAGSLVAIGAAMRVMPKNMLFQAISLTILGQALQSIGDAVLKMGETDAETVAHGILRVGSALVVIAAAMAVMPKNMLFQAISLTILASALDNIGRAVVLMGGMTWEEIAKGLITLAGALAIIATAMYFMTGTLAGAAALVVTAGALAILVPILIVLGTLEWETIIKALTTLAVTFAILGAAGFLLAPLVPVVLAFGAAVLMLGAGLALAGAGALAFATAFGIVVAIGGAGLSVMGKMISTFVSSIPKAMRAFGQGVVAFAKTIGNAAGVFGRAFGNILGAIIGAITRNIPKIGQLFGTLIMTAVRIVWKYAPLLFAVGLRLILRFLAVIRDHIGPIVTIAVQLVQKFANAIGNNAPKLAQSGIDLIIKLMDAMSRGIDRNAPRLGAAGGRLAWAIIRGMANGLWAGVSTVVSAAIGVAGNALSAAMNKLGINSPSKEFHKIGMYSSQGLAQGISAYSETVEKSASSVADTALDTIRVAMSGLSDAVSGEFDINPVITPILDLTQLQAEASKIGTSVSGSTITAGVTLNKAASVSADRQVTPDDGPDDGTPGAGQSPTFIQNNYSPKALSTAEIYRKTNNQFSFAKEALNL